MKEISAARRAPFGDNPEVGERGTRTQQALLTAAVEIFGEVGYAATRVEQITDRAGCSRPTFYQYFSSTEELFRRLAGRLGEDMVALIPELGELGPDAEGRARLDAWVRSLSDLHDERWPIFLAFTTAVRDDGAMVAGSAELAARFGKALIRATDANALVAHEDPELVASLLMTTTVRTLSLHSTVAPGLDTDRLCHAIGGVVHRSLYGRAAALPPPRSGGPRPEPLGPPPEPQPVEALVLPALDVPAGDDARDTWRRLVQAGREVFVTRGYADMRVDDVAMRAGVSHGTFYRYFANKVALFEVVAVDAAATMLDLLDDLPIDGPELDRWAALWFETYERHAPVFGVWSGAAWIGSEPDGSELAGLGRQVADTVRTKLATRLGPLSDPWADAVALLALLERAPYAAATYRTAQRSRVTEATTAIMRTGLLGAPR